MATLVEPEIRNRPRRKHCYTMWETLFDIHTKYRPIKPIGRATYGMVCSSINMDTNEKVAIKKISNVFDDCGDNVIALKDVMIPDQRTSFKDIYLVYEFMDKDLHRIKSSKPLSNDHCKLYLVQLLQGLNYLHSANILHRDLKPENLLVNANCDLKMCDFGLARENQVDELLLGCGNYGTSIDMWSVGSIFAEMLGRKPIFPGKDSLHQMKLIISVLGSQESDLELIVNPKTKAFIKSLPYTKGTHFSQLHPQADPLAIDLLQKMLVFDPTKRITASEVLQHPYMADLCDDQWRNRPPQVPLNLHIDENSDNKMIREMMWNEMLHYHPEAAFVNA
ncbi:MAP kinase-like protein [Medicago truncatula]|uniref:MAP kinase-like protein n=2 Tax=Medicago truncatula TaxID=3880 RepID=G7IXP3_MEDTR|nr:MAP kinase-like protein [Medicago truncatula]